MPAHRRVDRSVPIRPSSPEPAWVLAGRTWWRGAAQPVEVGIDDDGTIVRVGRALRAPRRRDVGEAWILPSATDLHVHLRDPPGLPDVETFATGTVGAARGGVGLVAEMPNTEPAVLDADRLAEKAERARGRLSVDLLLYGMLAPHADVEGLAAVAGGFKLYLSPTTGVDRPPTGEEVRRLVRRAENTGLPIAVHAEDADRFSAAGPDPPDPVGWNRARPMAAEAAAVDTILRSASEGARLHIAHVTQPALADRLAGRWSFEATPHHLLLSAQPGLGARGKVNPPLRPEPTRSALWDRFSRGLVPILASDHAPHAREAKDVGFRRAPSGMPGVETMLPLMLERCRAGMLGIGTLLAAACDRPARWLGQPRGRIAVGHRADLLVVDFRRRGSVRADRLASPCGWTAFEGWPAIFPIEHYLAGRRIVEEGEHVGAAEGGIVRPEFAPTSDGVRPGRSPPVRPPPR
ncbi:MAG: hypothetical protein QXG65_00965 [Thermoplasmata archaeon]